MLPKTTRLRFVKSKTPETIQAFCDRLDKRIEVKAVTHVDGFWFLWFIPDDNRSDVASGTLKEIKTVKKGGSNGSVK